MGTDHLKKRSVKNDERKLHIQSIIRKALERLNYPADVYELLKEPLRTLKFTIPVRMDDGAVKMFKGFRAQHNDAVGPTKGGIIMHPDVTEDEVQAASIWMSLKTGMMNLPYGGAKGGIVCDPREMSYRELEQLSRGYVRAISPFIGPTKDIFALNPLRNKQLLTWMLDEYCMIHQQNTPHFITGKPRSLGGTFGRKEAITKGVAVCLQEATELKNLRLQDAKIIIQGFGYVGGELAKYLYYKGAQIIGISDAYGAIYDSKGLDIPYLFDRRDSFGTVTKIFDQTMTNDELLELECDILIPAAVGNQITKANAHNIQAKIVIEAVQGATTDEATEILTKRDLLLIPDILAISGSLISSHFEWVQNTQGTQWSKEKVFDHIEQSLQEAFHRVYQTATTRKVNMRLAAYMAGVERMVEASRFRGWI